MKKEEGKNTKSLKPLSKADVKLLREQQAAILQSTSSPLMKKKKRYTSFKLSQMTTPTVLLARFTRNSAILMAYGG